MIKLLLNHTMNEVKYMDSVFGGPEGQKLMRALDAATTGAGSSSGGKEGSGKGGSGASVRSLSAAAYDKVEAEEVASLPQMKGV